MLVTSGLPPAFLAALFLAALFLAAPRSSVYAPEK
jgi:hypothetical protein